MHAIPFFLLIFVLAVLTGVRPWRLFGSYIGGMLLGLLICVVILLALFGRSNWFLVMAGIGAPIYFLLVLFAARPQTRGEAGSRVAPGANP